MTPSHFSTHLCIRHATLRQSLLEQIRNFRRGDKRNLQLAGNRRKSGTRDEGRKSSSMKREASSEREAESRHDKPDAVVRSGVEGSRKASVDDRIRTALAKERSLSSISGLKHGMCAREQGTAIYEDLRFLRRTPIGCCRTHHLTMCLYVCVRARWGGEETDPGVSGHCRTKRVTSLLHILRWDV